MTSPNLKPWAAEAMRKSNEEVLAGKYPFTARSSCMPARVPGFSSFVVEPVFFVQSPKEILITYSPTPARALNNNQWNSIDGGSRRTHPGAGRPTTAAHPIDFYQGNQWLGPTTYSRQPPRSPAWRLAVHSLSQVKEPKPPKSRMQVMVLGGAGSVGNCTPEAAAGPRP